MANPPSPYLEPIPDWTPEERPTLPGSPSMPKHSRRMRLVYFFIGIFIALTAGLRNGFISAKGLYMGLGFQQLGVPLACIISPFLTSIGDWTVLYTFELGLALCRLAMVVTVKLPPVSVSGCFKGWILSRLYWLRLL